MVVKLLLLGIVSSVYSQSFHRMIESEDLEHVFSVKNAAEVPDYDIVPISIRKPRSLGMNDRFLFQRPFGNSIKMWLTPSNGTLFSRNAPISFIRYDPLAKYELRRTVKKLDPASNFYENKFYATTLAVNYHTNEKYSVKGFIGSKYIKPIPPHLMDHARRHRRSVHKALDHESDDEIYHVVYDIPQAQEEMFSLPVESTLASSGTPQASNWTIYPEIFVIVEYGIVNKNLSLEDKVLYVMAFWNGVDMRYRNFVNPKIRLNIAGIVFAQDPYVLPHIHKFTDGRYIYDDDDALREMESWLYRIDHVFPNDFYDLAVTITNKLLCYKPDVSEDYICDTTGIAVNSGACKVGNREGKIYKVAFVQDSGRFNGIKTAAHELGHLLGVDNHDDVNEDETCDYSDGYLMTPSEDYADHSFEWSNCSIRQMGEFLRSNEALCLYNKPLSNRNPFPRFLPGKLFTPDEQCQALANASFNIAAEFNCHAMTCYLRNSPDQSFIIEPAEGTRCGYKKLCLHGFCIDENQIE